MIPENDGPKDTVESLEWSPVADFLLSGSWDKTIRCYQITSGMQVQSSLKGTIPVNAVPMDLAWRHDGQGFFTAASDGKVYWTDLNNTANPLQSCGNHQGIVRTVHWLQNPGILATSGSDSTIKFWDIRTSLNNQNAQPSRSITLPDRVIAMDIQYPVCVVLTINRGFYVFDLSNNSNQPIRSEKGSAAPLNKQYRCVSICPNKTYFVVSSIEGRVAVEYVSPNEQAKKFKYVCHRDKLKKLIYPVNRLCMHPKFYTFATCSGDGKYIFWDKDKKTKLEEGKPAMVNSSSGTIPLAVTAGNFSTNGDKFAFAVGYDWSMGIQGKKNYNGSDKPTIFIRNDCLQSAKPKS